MSTTAAFREWANRSDVARAVVFFCTLTRRSDGAQMMLPLSDSAPVRGTWDNLRNFEQCISSEPTITHQAQQTVNGRSLAAFGNLQLRLDSRSKLGPAGDLNWYQALNRYRWSGGEIVGLVGGPDLPWADWAVALRGHMGRVSHDETSAQVPILGAAAALATIKVPPDTYEVADAVPEATVGKVKPIALGPCNNVTPVLVSESPYTYQVHAYGPIQAISQVRVADVAVSPASLDLTNGKFTLGSKPEGSVTCDLQGWVRGGLYLDSAPRQMEALLRQFTGVVDAGLDLTAWAAGQAAAPAAITAYLTQALDIRTALDNLSLGLPLWWVDDALGRYALRVFAAPAGEPVLAVHDGSVGNPPYGAAWCWGVKVEPAPRWWSRCTVSGDRNWTRNTRPADSLSEDRKAWLREEYRARSASGDAPAGNPQVSEGDYKTGIASLEDCQAQAAREIAMHGVERNLVSFQSLYAALTLQLGDVVRVVSQVGEMDAGWLGVVVEKEPALPGLCRVRLWG